MNNIEITECDYTQIDSYFALLQRVFQGYDQAFFNWKYKTILRLKPMIVCAKHKHQIVSFNSWIHWEFNYNGQKIIAYQSGDSATDKNYRGKGIFRSVLKHGELIAKKRNIDFLMGFPSEMSYNTFYQENYYPIASFSYHIGLLNPFRIKSENYRNENTFFPESYLTELNRIVPTFDNNYFTWRYIDNPKNYQILKYEENNNYAVFIFIERSIKGIIEILLMDCQFSSYNETFTKNSISFFKRCLPRKAIFIRTFFNKNSNRGQVLYNHFPLQINKKNKTFIIKPLKKEISNIILNCNNWDIMPHCIDDL